MTYRGHVKNGVVVPEAGADLTEGAEVRIDVTASKRSIELKSASDDDATNGKQTMDERYKSIIGVIKDMPADASERIDEELYDRDER